MGSFLTVMQKRNALSINNWTYFFLSKRPHYARRLHFNTRRRQHECECAAKCL